MTKGISVFSGTFFIEVAKKVKFLEKMVKTMFFPNFFFRFVIYTKSHINSQNFNKIGFIYQKLTFSHKRHLTNRFVCPKLIFGHFGILKKLFMLNFGTGLTKITIKIHLDANPGAEV